MRSFSYSFFLCEWKIAFGVTYKGKCIVKCSFFQVKIFKFLKCLLECMLMQIYRNSITSWKKNLHVYFAVCTQDNKSLLIQINFLVVSHMCFAYRGSIYNIEYLQFA